MSHLQALVLCGDRAGLSTGASPHGRPTCACRAQGIYRCDHDRFSPDATATGDDDAYRETFVFGHRDVQHGVVTPDHPLPLQVLLAPGHSSESTLGPTALDRRLKLFTAPPGRRRSGRRSTTPAWRRRASTRCWAPSTSPPASP